MGSWDNGIEILRILEVWMRTAEGTTFRRNNGGSKYIVRQTMMFIYTAQIQPNVFKFAQQRLIVITMVKP